MKLIEVSRLTNKYCDEEYIRNIPCFFQWCNKVSTHVKFIKEGFPMQRQVFHCNIHKSEKHIKIQKYS